MMVVRSENVERLLWRIRGLLPQLEASPVTLARRQVGNYLVGLGTLGYLYLALSSVLEVLVEADKMAKDLRLGSYTVVIGPDSSYITRADMPEVVPPLPSPSQPPPLSREEVRLNSFGCPSLTQGMVKFCVGNAEIAYFLGR